jgi:diguanylate cyclase (GGDEF)-like protein
MRDPRTIEIEFLAELDKNDPGNVLPWEAEERLGVSRQFFKDMVLNLFREGCLEGTSSIMQPTVPGNREQGDLALWGTLARANQGAAPLLKHQSFAAYINHKGRLRMWELRDAVQRARIKEKFGILWDRRHWDSDVAIQLAMATKGAASAVLFMDLDSFKPVNDQLGHSAGDEVMRTYFDVVAKLTADIGEAYGWGGDEVAVLLPGIDPERVAKLKSAIADAVLNQCSEHPRLAAAAMKVGVSIGAYVFTGPESAKAMVEKADALMYAEKKKRKGTRNEVL